jgi:CubicO group peptidase (beta-lactamase class C family)
MNTTQTFCLGLLLILFSGLAAGEPSTVTVKHDARFSAARQLIIDRVSEDIPSFGITVVHRGEVLWEENFGWADVEAKRPATPNTPYSLASVAKSITSTGVLLLAQDQRLDLDHPVEEYLADDVLIPLSGSAQQTTVRHLLNMTAGVPMGFVSMYEPHIAPSGDELLRDHGGLQIFAPGEVFHYANFSHALAGMVIEDATDQSLNDAMTSVLFEQAGMTNTFYSGVSDDRTTAALSYDEGGSPYLQMTNMPAAGAGVYSSISDLRQYVLAHLGHPLPGDASNNALLSAASRAAMHGETTPESEGMFALGWWVVDLGDGASLVISDGHGTGMALVQMIPSEDIGIVCVMSTRMTEPNGEGFTNIVANMVADELMPGFSNRLESFWAALATRSQDQSTYHPREETMGRWTGFVRTFDDKQIPIEFLFQPDGDIHVTMENQYEVLLTETRYRNDLLEGWFPGLLPGAIPTEHIHDILARVSFGENTARGYLNANFSDHRGSFELPSYLYLEREQTAE